SFQKCMDSITKQLTDKAVAIQIPVGEGAKFEGIIDLIKMKFYKAKADRTPPEILDIPDNLKDIVEDYRTKIIDAVAVTDDAMMERYLNGETLSEQEIFEQLKKAIINDLLVPVLCGSSIKNCGLNNLFEKFIAMCASPLDRKIIEMENSNNPEEKAEIDITAQQPFAGLVFKTVVEDHLGEMSYIKCFCGTLKAGDEVLNSRTGTKERINQITAMVGKNRIDLGELATGDIGVLVKLKDTKVGDTLKNSSFSYNFKAINFPKPVLFNAIKAENKKDQEKLTSTIIALSQSDPTIKVFTDKVFNEFIISGMGEAQLDLLLKKAKQKTNINFEITPPRVPYRETIKKKVEAQGKYKKQSGGRGQYGDCHIRVEPLPRGQGVEFVDEIFGGAIPAKYVPAVEKGVRDALNRGYTAGYPIVDVKVAVYDGTYHDVDSSDLAFQIAGSFAVKAICEKCQPVILEPIYNLEVSIPESYMGDVIGDINSRRGKILGMDSNEGISIVKAQVPERELHRYATDLRSLTRGQGDFETSFSHYEEAPMDVAKKIIAEAEQYRKEAEEAK
ncbi:MAG TPA: elongation factor G, partial [bacterium]|nr:elongation factor G [bacterium]